MGKARVNGALGREGSEPPHPGRLPRWGEGESQEQFGGSKRERVLRRNLPPPSEEREKRPVEFFGNGSVSNPESLSG